MQKLDLSHNQIDFIEPGAFSSLNNLYELKLEGNSITKLEDGTFMKFNSPTALELKLN